MCKHRRCPIARLDPHDHLLRHVFRRRAAACAEVGNWAIIDRVGVWRAGTYQVLTVCHAPCIGLSQKDGRRSACRTRLRPRGGRPACGMWLTSHGRSTRLRHAADCGSGEAEFRSGSLQIGVLLPGRCTSATAPHVRVLPAHTIIRFEIRGFSDLSEWSCPLMPRACGECNG